MYYDIILALIKFKQEAWKKCRIKIEEPEVFPINIETFQLIKNKLDATNTALRAVDKEYTINSLFRKRKEFQAILLRVEEDIYNINDQIVVSNSGQILVSTTIIYFFNELSKDMHQIRGLVDGTDIEDLILKIENSELNINNKILENNNNNSIYRITDNDKII